MCAKSSKNFEKKLLDTYRLCSIVLFELSFYDVNDNDNDDVDSDDCNEDGGCSKYPAAADGHFNGMGCINAGDDETKHDDYLNIM